MKNNFLIVLFFMIFNVAYAQRTPNDNSILTEVRKKYLEELYFKCGSSYIRFYETNVEKINLDQVKKYIPYDFHTISFISLPYEFREKIDGYARIIVVYFIQIEKNDTLSFKSNRGQGNVELCIVPTTFFWSLKNDVIVFTLIEENITESIKITYRCINEHINTHIHRHLSCTPPAERKQTGRSSYRLPLRPVWPCGLPLRRERRGLLPVRQHG